MPRTITSINMYVEAITGKLREHSDPQQHAVILQDLHELVVESGGELSDDQLQEIKNAVSEGLGHGWVHIDEWQPRDDDQGEDIPSPTESLRDALSNLGVSYTWFEFGEDEKNVGHFLEARKPVEIIYRHYIGEDDDAEDRPIDTLTKDWIEEARANQVQGDIGLAFELTIDDVGWMIERYLRNYVSGYDPVEIIYAFGEGHDSIAASLLITPKTRISERNGRLVLNDCEMSVRLWEMIDYGDIIVSEKMSEAAWSNLGYGGIGVEKLVFNPETKTIEDFEVRGYMSLRSFFKP